MVWEARIPSRSAQEQTSLVYANLKPGQGMCSHGKIHWIHFRKRTEKEAKPRWLRGEGSEKEQLWEVADESCLSSAEQSAGSHPSALNAIGSWKCGADSRGKDKV